MRKLGNIDNIKLIIPEGGFYFTVDCNKFMNSKSFKTSMELAEDILIKTGVGVVPGSDFGINKTIRLSFANSEYDKAINLLRDYFLSTI